MLKLKDYLELAEKVIMKHGKFIASEDDISFVAEYMMRADKRYIEGVGNRNAFRVVNGKYAVIRLMTTRNKLRKRQEKINIESLDFEMDKQSNAKHIENIPDIKQKVPSFYFEHEELVSYINNCDKITDQQKEIILDFINSNCNKNPDPLRNFGLSKASYSIILDKVLTKIKYYYV
jgi:hypothetical protein